jgi:hypothetical protein
MDSQAAGSAFSPARYALPYGSDTGTARPRCGTNRIDADESLPDSRELATDAL